MPEGQIRDRRELADTLGAAMAGLAVYFVRPVRDVETALPDHDQLKKVEPASAA